MVETYLRVRSNLRTVVLILDIRRDPSIGDMNLLNWLDQYEIQAIPILTKADKLSRQHSHYRAGTIGSRLRKICPGEPILFSAKTKEGKEEIWDRIDSSIRTANLQGHRP